MKTEIIKCHEVVNGKKQFVGEGPLEIAETIEDILVLHDRGLTEDAVVSHFNSSRRIEFQRQLKNGGQAKIEKKAKEAKPAAEKQAEE